MTSKKRTIEVKFLSWGLVIIWPNPKRRTMFVMYLYSLEPQSFDWEI